MYDLQNFGIAEMARLGGALRGLRGEGGSMAEVAAKVAWELYDTLVDAEGHRACVLARLFKTHAYADLPPDLQEFVRSTGCDVLGTERLQCLTLLGTAGEKPEWSSAAASVGHRAIPLVTENAVRAIPMIAALVSELGLDIRRVVDPGPDMFFEKRAELFNVFHVPEAVGSPLVPSQADFVDPFGVRSVIGFGGGLRGGDFFAVILFSRVHIDAQAAGMFRTLSLNVRLALTACSRVFQ